MIDIKEKTKGLQQVTKNDSNWNIYADQDGFLWSIAIKEGCGDSTFGNARYLVSVIYKYGTFKMQDFTEYGLQLVKKSIGKFELKDVFREVK